MLLRYPCLVLINQGKFRGRLLAKVADCPNGSLEATRRHLQWFHATEIQLARPGPSWCENVESPRSKTSAKVTMCMVQATNNQPNGFRSFLDLPHDHGGNREIQNHATVVIMTDGYQ